MKILAAALIAALVPLASVSTALASPAEAQAAEPQVATGSALTEDSAPVVAEVSGDPVAGARIRPEHLALGDSFASGLGAGSESGACRRSQAAHPVLWAARLNSSLSFQACTGASTADVARQVAAGVNSETSSVTLTVGGNDAGFTEVMTTCTTGTDSSCARRVAAAEQFIRAELPARLDAAYAAVRARTPAPVAVVGYPRLFEEGFCLLGPSAARRAAVNRATDLIVATTAARAKAAGFSFVDVRPAFRGHGVCGGSPWVNGVSLPVNRSYHPNRAGQQAYAAALRAALLPAG
ncbi:MULTISPECIES: SGNH/GDSL hydrolase family protein [Actinosynnema]|uniref:SGNH/GDSL hydrolase family protein n=1 Tax=Actinosynnema TaxID=40566 RepID=UPI0020A299F7|nr:SGNH/GDSL hydrolase family protein [Actinosynnema pretiosum]MCP2095522.1 Lysophospholipase L1 [Actinosynnema pretiosum]